MHTFIPEDVKKVEFGTKSDVGTGGMESKVRSGLWAMENSCSVVICNGMRYNSIRKIMKGQKVGTFFSETVTGGPPTEILAKNGKNLAKFCFNKRIRERLIDFTSFFFFLNFHLTFPFPVSPSISSYWQQTTGITITKGSSRNH